MGTVPAIGTFFNFRDDFFRVAVDICVECGSTFHTGIHVRQHDADFIQTVHTVNPSVIF